MCNQPVSSIGNVSNKIGGRHLHDTTAPVRILYFGSRKNKCLAAHGSWKVRTPSHTSFGLVRNHSYWWYTYLGWSFITEATLVAELQGPSGGPFESPVQS